MFETNPLRVWALTAEELLDTANLDRAPTVYSSEDSGAVGVAPNGSVVVASKRADNAFEVVSLTANDDRGVRAVMSGGHIDQIVPVNDGALVLLDGDASWVVGGTSRLLASDVAVVQQAPTGSASSVAMIGHSGDVFVVDLSTNEVAVLGQLSGSSYAPPIHFRGCVFAVSLQPREFVKFCNGREAERSSLVGSVGTVRLRLVNSWVWVNELQTGAAWVASPDRELARIDDWGSALAEDEVDEAEATVDNPGKDPDRKEAPDADDPLFEAVDQFDEDDENEPPVAVDDVAATRSERTVLVPVLANDTDADGDVLAVSALGLPDRIPATVSVPPGSGTIQVRPDAGFSGALSFTYTVTDGRGGEATGTLSLTVAAADGATNEPPVPRTDVAVARAGSPVSLNVIDNDSDPEGDTLLLTAVEANSGQLTFDPSGSVTFTPDPTGDDGIVEMTYTVEDDFGATAQGRLRVRVRIATSNNEPDARNDLIVTNVGESTQLNVLANDTDPDDDPIYVAQQPIAKGLPAGVVVDDLVGLALATDGELSFTPPAPGTYRFEYLISDGQNSDRAQIRVEAQEASADQPPVAVRDDVAIPLGGTRIVYVLANDSDPNGDVVGVVEWDEAPGLSIVELPGTGFAVTVEVGAASRVPFRYAISDGHHEPVSTQVVVAVAEVPATNQPPQLTPDSFEVRAGRTSRLAVLANDSDPEGGSLRILHVPPLADQDATFAVGDRGQTVELTVPANQSSGFTFSYDVEDEAGTTSATSVDVRIIGANDPNRSPVPRADVGRTTEGESLLVDVLANDTDPDNDPLQVESVAQQPLFGSAQLGDDGTVTYQPNDGFTGTDRFSYVVVDTEGGRSVGHVRVGVMPRPTVNRAPKAYPDSYEVAAGNGAIALEVLANDVDPDGDRLSITSVGIANVGEIETDGATVTYQPPPPDGIPDEGLELSVYYEISDGAGHRDSAVITINIAARPDPVPPVATNDVAGPVRAGTTVLVPVLDNDYDPDGGSEQLQLSSSDPQVRVVGDNLEITAGPKSGQYTYTVTDADGLSDQASVTLFVVENQAPVVRRSAEETPSGVPVTIDLSALASDADGDDLYFVCCDGVQGGTVAVDASSSNTLRVTFTPNTGFSGQASFSYSVDDQHGHLVSGFASITVLPPSNRPPLVSPGSIDVEAGSSAVFDLATLVDDPDPGDTATFRLGATEAPFPVSLAGSVLTISAPVGSTGASSVVSFTASDSAGAETTGSVTVTVIASTKPLPTAVADVAQTTQGLALDINLLGNDIDPVGQGLTIVQIWGDDGRYVDRVRAWCRTVLTSPDFFRTATFTYTVVDATGDATRRAVGQVTITIIGRPGANCAVGGSGQRDGDGHLDISASKRVADRSLPTRHLEPDNGLDVSRGPRSPEQLPGHRTHKRRRLLVPLASPQCCGLGRLRRRERSSAPRHDPWSAGAAVSSSLPTANSTLLDCAAERRFTTHPIQARDRWWHVGCHKCWCWHHNIRVDRPDQRCRVPVPRCGNELGRRFRCLWLVDKRASARRTGKAFGPDRATRQPVPRPCVDTTGQQRRSDCQLRARGGVGRTNGRRPGRYDNELSLGSADERCDIPIPPSRRQ
ncbi:MAG: Ig-like domain-containing protein [Acidimicrobiales bacterium]